MAKKSGFVPRTFRDAGTQEVFEGGKSHLFEAGALENYKAAGLIGDAPAPKATRAKPKAKPKAAASAPAPAPDTSAPGA